VSQYGKNADFDEVYIKTHWCKKKNKIKHLMALNEQKKLPK